MADKDGGAAETKCAEEVNEDIVDFMQEVYDHVESLHDAEDLLLRTICPRFERDDAALSGKFSGVYHGYHNSPLMTLPPVRGSDGGGGDGNDSDGSGSGGGGGLVRSGNNNNNRRGSADSNDSGQLGASVTYREEGPGACMLGFRKPLRRIMEKISFKAARGVYLRERELARDVEVFTRAYRAYFEGSQEMTRAVILVLERNATDAAALSADEQLTEALRACKDHRVLLKTYLSRFHALMDEFPPVESGDDNDDGSDDGSDDDDD